MKKVICGIEKYPWCDRFIDGVPFLKYACQFDKDLAKLVNEDSNEYQDLCRKIKYRINKRYAWTYLNDLIDFEEKTIYMINEVDSLEVRLLTIPKIEDVVPIIELKENDIVLDVGNTNRIVIRDGEIIYNINLSLLSEDNNARVVHI